MTNKYSSLSIENLQELVNSSISISQLMKKLGYTGNRGSSRKYLLLYLNNHNINYSHFKGKAHGTTNTQKYKLDDILIYDSPYENTTCLKRRIIKEHKIIYKCDNCGLENWLNKPISLQLHHKDGNNRNHTLTNLQFLCPNCHSQTESYCRKLA